MFYPGCVFCVTKLLTGHILCVDKCPDDCVRVCDDYVRVCDDYVRVCVMIMSVCVMTVSVCVR